MVELKGREGDRKREEGGTVRKAWVSVMSMCVPTFPSSPRQTYRVSAANTMESPQTTPAMVVPVLSTLGQEGGGGREAGEKV